MAYFPLIVGVAALVGLAVFFWRRNGPGSGRAFGNRIAAHLGMPRSVFYALLEHGAKESSRPLLAALEASTPGLEAASVELGPVLQKGVERLEAHFGPQEMVEQVKPVVARLVAAARREP